MRSLDNILDDIQKLKSKDNYYEYNQLYKIRKLAIELKNKIDGIVSFPPDD